MTDWARIKLCDECGKGNPADAARCLNCGHELGSGPAVYPAAYPDHARPYVPPDTSVPFVARRAPGEIERAERIIQSEGIFSWCAPEREPRELTDKMIADAENALRVKLPASLLAILKMQNGGYPQKRRFHPDYVDLHELCGIAPGCATLGSLQEMPERIWDILEGHLDDRTYQQWRDTFKG